MRDIFYDTSSPSCFRYGNGRAAGSLSSTCLYYRIKRGKVTTVAHKLVWELFTGRAVRAGYQLDHIDGNPVNNRIENLREVLPSINARNRRKQQAVKSGISNVNLTENSLGNRYYVVEWTDLLGQKTRKRFSVTKLGEERARSDAEAYKLACKPIMLAAGYTGRHVDGN